MATFTIIAGIIISAIVSSLFSESIVIGLGKMLAKIDLPQKASIEGIWDATFTLSEGNSVVEYHETIKIVKRLGSIYGYNIPDPKNHEILKEVENLKPLRIRANIMDNRFITGTWYHPNRKTRYHGSFQLLLGVSGNKINGLWTGYRESTNTIETGAWHWRQRK